MAGRYTLEQRNKLIAELMQHSSLICKSLIKDLKNIDPEDDSDVYEISRKFKNVGTALSELGQALQRDSSVTIL